MFHVADAAASVPGWHPHLDVWVLMTTLLVGYFAALRWVAPRKAPQGRPPATLRQKVAFVSGVAILWIGADWPIHEISENFLFSVHMTQHTLFSLVAPPLLLIGTPPWLARFLLGRGLVFRAVRFVTRPLIALLLFNAVIVITHWPVLVNASLRSEPVHLAVHTVLVAASLAMWWPVITPLPETARLSEPAKMLYLFLQSIVPTVPASFLTFADTSFYSFYAAAPRLWGIDVVTDQRMAGLIMKIVGGLLLWIAIAMVFFRWNAREERNQVDEVPWEDFERELEVWKLRQS